MFRKSRRWQISTKLVRRTLLVFCIFSVRDESREVSKISRLGVHRKSMQLVGLGTIELWFLFHLICLDIRTASDFRDASAVHTVPYASEIVNLSFRELPRTLCFHRSDSLASAATRFASAKLFLVLYISIRLLFLQASMSFRGKKLQKCFRELLRVGPEAHFTCLMSNSLFVLTKFKKTPLNSYLPCQ